MARKQSERECPIQAPRTLVEAAPKQNIMLTQIGNILYGTNQIQISY